MATIKWNLDGFREARTSPKVLDLLADEAERIAGQCGDGYEARGPEVSGGRGRGRAAVVTTTVKAMVHEAKHHTLANSV